MAVYEISAVTTVISLLIILFTVIRLHRFVKNTQNSGAGIWSDLGEGLFIGMSLVLLGQIIHALKFMYAGEVFWNTIIIGSSASYLVASVLMTHYVWTAMKKLREVSG